MRVVPRTRKQVVKAPARWAKARLRGVTWSHAVLCSFAAALIGVASAPHAQEIEPRAYFNLPSGVNFFLAGYAYSEGGLSTDPALPIEDAHLKIHTGLVAYVHSFGMWGKSSKVDIILPYSQLSGTALIAGRLQERNISGWGDPRIRLSVNLYGAPSLSLPEFAKFRQDLVIGASVQVSAPTGQYDADRIVNLGANRWSVKPDIGFSKVLGAWTVDLTGGVVFFADNTDYSGGKRLEQDPIYTIQSNVSYNFSGGTWVAFGGTFYHGGRTTLEGVPRDDGLSNSRVGATLAIPIDRYQSLKINASGGVTTRVGTSFKTLGVAWQYRWGGGF
jgi:hypothetical protein